MYEGLRAAPSQFQPDCDVWLANDDYLCVREPLAANIDQVHQLSRNARELACDCSLRSVFPASFLIIPEYGASE